MKRGAQGAPGLVDGFRLAPLQAAGNGVDDGAADDSGQRHDERDERDGGYGVRHSSRYRTIARCVGSGRSRHATRRRRIRER